MTMSTKATSPPDFIVIADDDNPLIDTLQATELAELANLWTQGQTNFEKNYFAKHLFQPTKTIVAHCEYGLGDFHHVSMQIADEMGEPENQQQAIENLPPIEPKTNKAQPTIIKHTKTTKALANPKLHKNLLNQKKSMIDTQTVAKDSFSELEHDLQVIDLSDNVSKKHQQIYHQALEVLANPKVKNHHQKALAVVQKFAHANSTDAMLRLALWALRGNAYLGIDKNSEQGLKWLKQAAKLHDNRAQKLLSKLYFSGDLLDLDVKQGEYWLNQAAKHGHNQAKQLQQAFNSAEMLKQTRTEENKYWKKLGLLVILLVFVLFAVLLVKI
ncbi:hypothetical protein MOMA_05731 [Moraxella macacae 0408225]|uniref:Sel1 repeat family protein n=1 Tax=Moraxella macacae 0408225 TaxID=1230338 RepID=L2F5I2_9GAMM|nr:tetratricopeptide repeat protein [Moraxella macacae]ELA08036.1 hypothetical protein MOMA_05731 [Moraxella macacae 0408225]